jgi:hypothetical protein
MFTAFWPRSERAPRRTKRPRLHLEPLEERCVLSTDVIFDWHETFHNLTGLGIQPDTIEVHRTYAMLHVAMFDAVNSIVGTYTPFYTSVQAAPNASPVAAAAQAAHDLLLGLFPTVQEQLDAALADSLQGIPPDQAAAGSQVGSAVAQVVLTQRTNDGWEQPFFPYDEGNATGVWVPTPPNFFPALFTNAPYVTPFALHSTDQFLPGPPPDLAGPEYAASFNTVKDIGRIDSTTRTADQTLAANLWASVGTFTSDLDIWNYAAEYVADGANLALPERARLFALLNVSDHDALISTFYAKYYYGLWRPVTAIPRADETGNPDTQADPNWSPLLVTPAFPSYPSNHSAVAGSSATILASFFGTDAIPFQVTWNVINITRSYPGFQAMADESGMSRIWGGIHYPFDNTVGQALGDNVGNFVFQNVMQPLQRPGGGAGPGASSGHGFGVPSSWRELAAPGLVTSGSPLATHATTPVSALPPSVTSAPVSTTGLSPDRGDNLVSNREPAALVGDPGVAPTPHRIEAGPATSDGEEVLFGDIGG